MVNVITALKNIIQNIKLLRQSTDHLLNITKEVIPISNSIDRNMTNTYAYTGLSWTCPTDAIICMTAKGLWYSACCYEIGIHGDTSNVSSMIAYNDTNGKQASVQCTVVHKCKAGDTFYVWGRWSYNSSNRAEIQGFYIPL